MHHFVSLSSLGGLRGCEPHPLRFPIPSVFLWDTASAHSAEKQPSCLTLTLTSREWSSRGEPNSSWAEPKGPELCHVEQGGAVWGVSATWISISRLQWSGKKMGSTVQTILVFWDMSIIVIVSGSGMGVPAARSTLYLVFVRKTKWCCSQEQLPPYFCPSSHMELNWAGEHHSVCNAPSLLCTFFINVVVIAMLFLFNCFLLSGNCCLNP